MQRSDKRNFCGLKKYYCQYLIILTAIKAWSESPVEPFGRHRVNFTHVLRTWVNNSRKRTRSKNVGHFGTCYYQKRIKTVVIGSLFDFLLMTRQSCNGNNQNLYMRKASCLENKTSLYTTTYKYYKNTWL